MATQVTPAKRAKRFRDKTRVGLVRRACRMGRTLAETYPDAHCELNFNSPFELLVATVMSAQTTDARVNLVTPTPVREVSFTQATGR
jgi:endonuclease III